VIDATGADLVNLTNDPADDGDPSWSPDGTRIAFLRNFKTSNPACADLWEINPDGTGLHQLAPTPLCHEETLTWSPDGTKLTFASWDDGSEPRNGSDAVFAAVAAAVWIAQGCPLSFPTGRMLR